MASPSASPADIHQTIQQVISDPSFKHSDSGAILGANALSKAGNVLSKVFKKVDAAFQKLAHFIEKLFKPFEGHSGNNVVTSRVIVGIMITLLVLAGAYLVYQIVRQWLANKSLTQDGNLALIFTDSDLPLVIDPDAWHRNADKLAAQGRYQEAYRALYISLLMQFHVAGLIVIESGKTNGDYLREVPGILKSDALQQFRVITWGFESAWYGKRPVSAQRYRRAAEAAQRLIADTCRLEVARR
jgi:hypothetical protein